MGTGGYTNIERLSGSFRKIEKNNDNRIGFVDFIRGVAILSIVWGHVAGGGEGLHFWNNYTNFFKIMIFYVLSGYLKRSVGPAEIRCYMKKRLQTLGMAYLCLSVTAILADVVLIILNGESLVKIAGDLYRTVCLAGVGPLWFLPSLFGAEGIALSVIKRGKVKKFMIAGYVISVIGIKTLNYFRSESLIFDVITAPIIVVIKCVIGALFIILGMKLKSVEHYIKKRWFLTFGVLIVGILVCNILELSDFNHLSINCIVCWYIGTIISCFSVFIFAVNYYYINGGGQN